MKNIEIKTNYTLLHFDEYPILFIGKNADDEIVIGSFLFEISNNNFSYFHSIITSEIATKFLNQNISYLETLQNAVAIFIVEKDINNKILSKKARKFDNIDKAILPLPSAFCPDVDKQLILPFTVKPNLTHVVVNAAYRGFNKPLVKPITTYKNT